MTGSVAFTSSTALLTRSSVIWPSNVDEEDVFQAFRCEGLDSDLRHG